MTPQELKSSILQLAIQGKLVEQLESEKGVDVRSSFGGETADFFEIPDNWKWLAIKDVATVVTGLSFKKQDQKDISNGTLRVLRGGNIGDDYKYHLYEDDVFVNLEQFQSKYISLLKGDVITPSVTSMEKICKSGFIDKNLNSVTAGGFVYIIRCLNDDVLDAKYLLYFISSSFNKVQCKPNIHKSGQAFYNLKKSGFVEQPICVPPLAEQKRIVAKIEELLPYIDRYEKAWSRLEDFNKRFPVDMQKSILQMAIQGKLVEQRPDEGTGEELYRQIQAEKQKLIEEGKIKKEKPLPEITEDEIPFDIPESWKWVRLQNLCSFIGDIDHNMPKSVPPQNGVLFLSAKDLLDDGTINYTEDVKFISHNDFERLSRKARPNRDDIVYSRIGAALGKARVVESDITFLVSYSCCIIRPLCVDAKFLRYYLESPLIMSHSIKARQSIGVPDLGMGEIKRYLVALPPLAEQKRIVAKLEEILPMCERLK